MLTVGLVLVALAALAASARVMWVSAAPKDPDRVGRQLDFLHSAIDAGKAREMQGLFPEGEFFTLVLTGLADAQAGRLPQAEAMLAASGRDEIADRFGTIKALEHGTFYRGWRLLLSTEIASRSAAEPPAELQTEADAIEAALLADRKGVPESYPSGRWPCDAVVAMAAVVRAHALADRSTATDAWVRKLDRIRDPATGLLPHRLDAGSTSPQGSSQAIIQSFWPDIVDSPAAEWKRFKDAFVTTEFGLVGVREHPIGASGSSNIDSGPLLLGVSPSASAVGLAAARANGDAGLADDLDREAELLGFPLDAAGGRSFLGGVLPVGDAWVAWARGVPQPKAVTYDRDKRSSLWAWTVPGMVLAVLAAIVLMRRVRRSR